jgi:hypothetical protein
MHGCVTPTFGKAKKRIADLEAELAISRRATELLKEETSPQGGTQPSK